MDHQTKASHRLGACSMTRQQQQYHSPPDTPTNPTANDGGEHTTTHSSSSSSSSSAAFVSLTQPGLVLTIPLGVPLKKYDPSTSPPVDKTQQDHIKQHRTATQPKTQAGTAAPKGPTAFNSDSTSTASNNNRNNNSSTTTASSSSSTKKVNRLKVVFNPAVELVEIYEPALDHFRTYRQEILDARLDRIRTIQERITFCKSKLVGVLAHKQLSSRMEDGGAAPQDRVQRRYAEHAALTRSLVQTEVAAFLTKLGQEEPNDACDEPTPQSVAIAKRAAEANAEWGIRCTVTISSTATPHHASTTTTTSSSSNSSSTTTSTTTTTTTTTITATTTTTTMLVTRIAPGLERTTSRESSTSTSSSACSLGPGDGDDDDAEYQRMLQEAEALGCANDDDDDDDWSEWSDEEDDDDEEEEEEE